MSDAGESWYASPVSWATALAPVGSTLPIGSPRIICAIAPDQRASSTCRSDASGEVRSNVM